MKQKLILLLYFAMPLFCMAQSRLVRQYSYDASGNRTSCAVINLSPPQAPPQTPPDSTETEELRVLSFGFSGDELQVTSDELQELKTEHFVEKIAQVEIEIYPNPATEKVTLAISEWDNLQTGIFKLYSLTGQLLQEQPVHSATTVISLAGYANGAYILKVQINGITEDWKVIKQ